MPAATRVMRSCMRSVAQRRVEMRNMRITLLAMTLLATAACGGADTTSSKTPNALVYLYRTPDDALPTANTSITSAAKVGAHSSALFMGAVTIDEIDSIMVDVLAVGAVQPTDTTENASALTIA